MTLAEALERAESRARWLGHPYVVIQRRNDFRETDLRVVRLQVWEVFQHDAQLAALWLVMVRDDVATTVPYSPEAAYNIDQNTRGRVA